MKGKFTLQQRLILPIVLLGLVTLLSNLLAVFSINNVHANAGTIVDEYMVSEARLEEIRRSMMDIHRLSLSHIVAADHSILCGVCCTRRRGGLPQSAGQLCSLQARAGRLSLCQR